MTPDQTISDARRKLLRSVAWQVLLVAGFQFGSAWMEYRSSPGMWQSVVLGLLAIPPLLSISSVRSLSIGFVVPLGLYSISAPWIMGGLLHPITLLPIVAIHSVAFLLGTRAAVWMTVASLANLLALSICESRGIVAASIPPSLESRIVFVSAFTLHALLFISIPLDTIRQFLTQARADLLERRSNETELQTLTGSLEAAVATRRQELFARRAQLQRSADEVAAAMRSSILRMIEVSRELSESLPEELREARWASFRIAAACERMETMQVSLHRFCRMGEGSIVRRQLSPQAHIGMIHRIWDEVRNLQPDWPVSFFLDPIPGCTCDTELLRQVWQNLLTYSVRSASPVQNSPMVRVRFIDGEFCIEDNGAPLAQERATMIFGAARSQHEDGEEPGEWIALAMARRIVEVHGGGMRIENVGDKGNRLLFHIPEEA